MAGGGGGGGGGGASHDHHIAAARSSQQAGAEQVPGGSGGQIGRKIYQICFLSASASILYLPHADHSGFLRAGSNEYNERLTRPNCRAGPCGAQGLMCRAMGELHNNQIKSAFWKSNISSRHHHRHKISCKYKVKSSQTK